MEADLTVRHKGNELLLKHRGKTVLQLRPTRFFRSPESFLKTFSLKIDRLHHFRQFTFLSLITASPLLLYLLLYTLVLNGLILLSWGRKAELVSALICLVIAAAIAASLYSLSKGAKGAYNQAEIRARLQSEDWQARVGAMKTILSAETDANNYEGAIIRLKNSDWTAERYWMAKVLCESDSEKTFQGLIQLLNDPHPNVVCAALYSLGRRKDPAAIAPIRGILVSSDHWYIQLYAYNALKELGWSQPASD